MAGPMGRLTAALATIHNENSLSLANLNFDFTMIKLEAPAEFRDLTGAISKNRRLEAEQGPLHRTARKLGALFEKSLPKTPALFRAYGTRASEISEALSATTREPRGVFANQMGPDTTSLWAAATSGTGAIAVHMLGCMLARIFTGIEATSIWVELVEKQKEHIQEEMRADLYSQNHDAAMMAAMQDIPREDLANWDSSARAWIQSADIIKELQHKQLMLILDNACIPVNQEPNTYDGVMKAWTTALMAMDNLIHGMPQQVQDGASLLGISSWHLYPDISVSGKTSVEVKQKDSIFGPIAVLSLGLQIQDERSVSWSLPLARLQYYGHPVQTSRTVGQDNARVTIAQFSFVILGSLFRGWEDYANTPEEGLRWLEDMCDIMKPNVSTASKDRLTIDHDPSLFWLTYIRDAARDFTRCSGIEKKLALQLIALGKRRPQFLCGDRKRPLPLFGLCRMDTLLSLLDDVDSRIKFFRALGKVLALSSPKFFIRYYHLKAMRHVYASIDSEALQNHEIDSSGPSNNVPARRRWIVLHGKGELQNLINDLKEFLKDNKDFFRAHEAILRAGELCQVAFEPVRKVLTVVFGHGSSLQDSAKDLFRKLANIEREENDSADQVADRSYAAKQEVGLRLYSGNPLDVAIHSGRRYRIKPLPDTRLDPKLLRDFSAIQHLDKGRVTEYFVHERGFVTIESLKRCAALSGIYKLLPGATISTLVLSQSITDALWAMSCRQNNGFLILSRSETFACIAMFDSGTCNLDPPSLTEVFAMACGNSIYVASALLCDPWELPKANEVRRVLGNVGRAGISLLISPRELKFRGINNESWREINHSPFDGHLEDCFNHTSIHLSFTAYEMPLRTNTNDRHIIDRSVRLIETLISVHDQGKWIADIDILKALCKDGQGGVSQIHRPCCIHLPADSKSLPPSSPQIAHTYEEAVKICPALAATSIDNWDELLDAPDSGTMIVRAHKNWLARLAMVGACDKLGYTTVVLPEEPCWSCCASLIKRKEKRSFTHSHEKSSEEVKEDEGETDEDQSGSSEEDSQASVSSSDSDENTVEASNLDSYGSERRNQILLVC